MTVISKNNDGFSLVEVLIAMGIFSLIIGSIMAVFLGALRAKDIIFEQLRVQSEARAEAQNFIDEIRRANYSSIGAYPIEAAGTSTIIFYSDIDRDTFRERVRYWLSGTTLKKGVIKPAGTPLSYPPASEVITDAVHDVINTSSIFYYYDQNYNGGATSTALAQPVDVTAVRMAGIELKIEKDINKSPTPLYVETKTEIRNLKNN